MKKLKAGNWDDEPLLAACVFYSVLRRIELTRPSGLGMVSADAKSRLSLYRYPSP